MALTITNSRTQDIRFPTSRSGKGSDAMHTAPDYSAAYVVLETNGGDGPEGHGLTFTIGRGTEVCVAAIEALAPTVVGRTLPSITEDMAGFWRALASDDQLRWLGPETGVIHLATAALVNAVWDLYAKVEGKPLWKLLADMTAQEIVGCVDFRYIRDAITPAEALDLLERQAPTAETREAKIRDRGYPAYTTSAGWLGHDDAEIRRRCRAAVEAGWDHVKIKVGADPEADRRRVALVRQEIGPDRRLLLDANQRWGVEEAVERMGPLAEFDPWWIEEPTSPGDIRGHARIADAIAPVGVATGEQCPNRVVFKQLLQAGALDFCQVDACRLGGVNEVLAVLLMAAKYDVPVCPHAGGVGLCEYVQHLSIFDYLRVSGSLEHRVVEYVDHLHEHFEDPVTIENGRYMPPTAPGYSITMTPGSRRRFAYPEGAAWAA